MDDHPWSGRLVIGVINPATRRPAGRIEAALRRHVPPGVELDFRFTDPGGRLQKILGPRLAEAAAVIACGGDGTVADVVTALGDHRIPVGIVPGGSTNIIARENHIPLKPDAAARLIFGPHRVVRIDVGTCGERRFLHMAGAGLDSRLFAATNARLKRRIGWPAYLPAALRHLLAGPTRMTVAVDGAVVEARSSLVLIANGASIAHPALPVFPALRRDDGLLDVLIFTPAGPLQIGRTVIRFVTRSLQHSPYVIHLRGKEITLDSDPPIPMQIDGDIVGPTPGHFGVLPGAVQLIAP